VPLSEAPYGQTAVYGNALSTDSLLRIAVAKFDSALAIPHDSLRFSTLAKIGKARALMSLGRYNDAFQAASSVAPTDVYNLHYTEAITPIPNAPVPGALDAFWTVANNHRPASEGHEIVNREGNNGLTWYVNPAAIDPRVPVTVTVTNNTVYTFPAVVRQKKFVNGTVVFKLASWIEARMVESEYLLSIGDPNWIAPINAARGTVGLADTTAPATKAQQVDLLFRERAFWFYGHATRLADMRRLVRQYGRHVNTVFPTGQYTRSTTIYTYGDAVAFIPTLEEFTKNHKYSGCINRNA
jgi:hypothetical protein